MESRSFWLAAQPWRRGVSISELSGVRACAFASCHCDSGRQRFTRHARLRLLRAGELSRCGQDDRPSRRSRRARHCTWLRLGGIARRLGELIPATKILSEYEKADLTTDQILLVGQL